MPDHVLPQPAVDRRCSPRLHLASHMRACEVDGQVILLDLRRGRYLGIGTEQARAMASLVVGWPIEASACTGSEPHTSTNASAMTSRLLARGVLSDDSGDGPMPTFIQPPEATLDPQTSHASVSINPARCARFAKAVSSAYLSLRLRSLQSIATNVLRRRLRAWPGSASDDRSLREAVAAYAQLRLLVFTVRDKCLFDSLAMLDFLAAEGVHVNWLIGVKTHPFTAHSWLQSGPFVLNDHHEHVRGYRPILGV